MVGPQPLRRFQHIAKFNNHNLTARETHHSCKFPFSMIGESRNTAVKPKL